MKYKFLRLIRAGKRFKKEFRTELRLLIIITLGFTIAFSWRQTIFDISQNFIHLIIKGESSQLSTIFTSIFITIISLLLISITSKILKKDNN